MRMKPSLRLHKLNSPQRSHQPSEVVHQRNLQVASSRPDLRMTLELRLELKLVPAIGPVQAKSPWEAEGEELLLSARCRGNSGC